MNIGKIKLDLTFFKFALVGILNTGLTIAVIFLLKYFFSTDDVLANFVGYVFGLACSYFLNKKAAIYIDIESYVFGGQKVSFQTFLFPKNYYTEKAKASSIFSIRFVSYFYKILSNKCAHRKIEQAGSS